MKYSLFFTALVILLFCFSPESRAQIKDPVKTAEEKGENRVNKGIDKTIDKGFDKIEEGIGSLFKKKDKKNKQDGDSKSEASAKDAEQGHTEKAGAGNGSNAAPVLNWAKYDFVPGDKVIFEDNLAGEENGEFPSRWDLYSGNVEIVEFGGENVIRFMSGQSTIIPYLKDPGKDYLPQIFTIEMDMYFDTSEPATYFVYLHDLKNQKGSSLDKIQCLPGGLVTGETQKAYTGLNLWNKPEKSQWRHIAIGFNTRALKVYYDDERLINIPNLGYNPTGLSIGMVNTSNPMFYFIKNIRIAEGGQKLYDRFLQDGKIVSNGIRFDVNKSTLKSESMGVINEIYDLMTEHPEISFSVEGHTDSDGDDAFNQTLSEQRAETVVNTLKKLGIDGSRLRSKGWGESKPVDTNATPEGKANNRRVEFVKI